MRSFLAPFLLRPARRTPESGWPDPESGQADPWVRLAVVHPGTQVLGVQTLREFGDNIVCRKNMSLAGGDVVFGCDMVVCGVLLVDADLPSLDRCVVARRITRCGGTDVLSQR